MSPHGRAVGTTVGVVSVVVVVALAGIGLILLTNQVENPGGPSVPATSQSTSCSGYPPGGDCIVPYSYTFTIAVNYSGPSRLTYSGQTNVGESNPYNVTGSYTRTGNFSVSVSLTGLNNRELELCAQGQKLDGTNSTLYISIGPLFPENTSLPYGSVSTCGGVAP